jgi:hypothetical protein
MKQKIKIAIFLTLFFLSSKAFSYSITVKGPIAFLNAHPTNLDPILPINVVTVEIHGEDKNGKDILYSTFILNRSHSEELVYLPRDDWGESSLSVIYSIRGIDKNNKLFFQEPRKINFIKEFIKEFEDIDISFNEGQDSSLSNALKVTVTKPGGVLYGYFNTPDSTSHPIKRIDVTLDHGLLVYYEGGYKTQGYLYSWHQ